MNELSSSPPLSNQRLARMDRSPVLASHQKMPAFSVEAMVIRRSTPGLATAPTTPRPLPIRMMKKMTFQKSATLACRNARPSSL